MKDINFKKRQWPVTANCLLNTTVYYRIYPYIMVFTQPVTHKRILIDISIIVWIEAHHQISDCLKKYGTPI